MRKLKITSMVLVVVMLLSMLPLGMFVASAETPTRPATLPNGKSYYTRNYYTGAEEITKNAGEYLTSSRGGRSLAWHGAEGIMFKCDTTNATGQISFNVQFQMEGTISTNTASYARFSTSINDKNWNDYRGYRTYSYTTTDGVQWTEYSQGYDGIGLTSSKVNKDANTNVSWTYFPLESFRFFGTGNGSYDVSTEEGAFARSLVGKSIKEVLELFESQKIQFNIIPYADGMVVNSIDFCYEIDDLSKPANVTETKIEFDTNSSEGGVTHMVADGALTVTDMFTSNKDDARAFIGRNNNGLGTVDLTDALGVQVYVDSSALGEDAQLLFKMRLQRYATPGDLSYANGVIYNIYGSKFHTKNAEGNRVYGSANNGIYEVFNSKDNDTGVHGGYVQLATRSGGAVAYITGTDAAGNEYTNTPVYTEGLDYIASTEDAFLLPAGFEGTVYVPMDSYYLNVYGSYGSAMLTPFNKGLLTEFNAFGLYSSVQGTPVENKVVYSDFTLVEQKTLEINSKDELTAFANALAGGNTFEGYNVYLNTDVTYNAGKDVKSLNAAPAEVWPNMTNKGFAGTFDGRGHTISGVYQSGTGYSGMFGNVLKGDHAVIKNLTVVNSKITHTNPSVGGFFGYVNNNEGVTINDIQFASYEEADTSATFENVYMDMYVYSTKCSGSAGVGGFIGTAQGDASFVDCVMAGRVEVPARAAAGFIGCMRARFDDNFEAAGLKGCDFFTLHVNLENCVNSGEIVGSGVFHAGVIGYSQAASAHVNVDGYYSTATFLNTDGTARAKADVGALVGGCYSTGTKNRATMAGHVAQYNDAQLWTLSNIHIVGDWNLDDGVSAKIKMSYSTANGIQTYTHDENGVWQGNAGYDANADKDADGTPEPTTYNWAAPAGLTAQATGITTLVALPDVLMVRNNPLQQSVTLTDDLALNIYIPEYNVIAKSDDVKLTLTVNGNGNVLTKANGYWSYSVTDILPQEMNKTVTASVTLNGDTTTKTTSIAAYLKALLADANQPAAVKKLASDLLRYGDAAQNYTGYETGNLASAGAALVAGSVVDAEAIVADAPVRGTNVTAVALRLENTLALIGNYGETVVEVYASEMDENKTVGDATCSVAAYVKWALSAESGLAQNQKDLISAIYAYGMSAKAYKG